MKTIAAIIAGLLLSMTTFVAGLVIALIFLNAGEPDHRLDGEDVTALWSTEPVAIDKSSQPFERLPALVVPKAQAVAALDRTAAGARAAVETTPAEARQDEEPAVDPVITGSIEREPQTKPRRQKWRTTAHAEWCSRRYRSYDAETNSYRPYGGGRRACQSPYSDVATDIPAETADDDPTDPAPAVRTAVDRDAPDMEQAAYQEQPEALADSEHVESCFARYRSYRPEDNSYQPFDGGPRRQCE